jgi:hypothetical protein
VPNQPTISGDVDDAVGPVPPANQPGHVDEHPPDKPDEVPAAYRVDEGPADAAAHDPQRFGFAFEPLMAPFSFAVGVTPLTAWVSVDDDSFEVRFGAWHLRTPRANVVGATVTGPYRFAKVVGPAHLSFADRGVTFATNRRAGVCVQFDEPVPALLPGGRLGHPAATVTVADPDALVRLLRSER